ncbi:SDR family NAD(P)-dependent oxidoreductase [Achromobacter sp. NFACC18-2]|uniref:SDR family NAD(P)-dependent oxidoreductase n=1 Tax=Achromobacter sp. NFACC18-2 TaxID=1564112 RepID=UPI0008C5EDDC|nr:SDR family oxidoreductase [Achromobacter sp. NFACC18-2]SEJ02385.1 NAD(P)-dependent dehydrogenase, short-chain alcohol dehydrogenase family [Achromobacter sp. NFACC18-2]
MNPHQLSGKVALVTGGNSGIGLASAHAFAQAGARVVILGRRQDAVDAAVQSIGHDAVGVTGDVAELDTHDRVAAEIRQRFGGLDIYMANAGVALIEPSPEVSVAHYDQQFATNARGVFFGVTKTLPVLNHGASIILVSSIASAKVLEGHAVYAASKAAVEAFARSWALELKDRCIRVNVISPGPVDTPILEKLGLPSAARAGLDDAMAAAIPLARMGRPGELARAALFLASDASCFVTGANIRVDGGMALT